MFTVLELPGYTGPSNIRMIMATVYGAQSFGQIAGISFFIYLTMLMSIFTIIGLVWKGTNRIRYNDLYEEMKKKGKTQESEEPLVKEDSDDEEEDLFK